MDLTQYKDEIDKIKKEAEIKKFAISKKYALSNNPIKIGDKVTDHIGTIKVEGIGVFMEPVPSCIYRGVCYTKAGKPVKSNEKRNVYQDNIFTQPERS